MAGAGQRPEPRAAAACRDDRVEHRQPMMPEAARARAVARRRQERARLHGAMCTSALDVPGELLGPVEAGLGQRAAAAASSSSRAAEVDGDLVGVLAGVRDRVAAHLRQRQPRAWSAPAPRTPSPPGSAARSPRRRTGTRRPGRRRGSRAGRRSAGSRGAAAAGAAGTSATAAVDLVVVPLAAGDHQRGRVGPVAHRPRPAADQVGHVLARLLGAEERDVAAAAQPEPGARRGPSPRRSAAWNASGSTPW